MTAKPSSGLLTTTMNILQNYICCKSHVLDEFNSIGELLWLSRKSHSKMIRDMVKSLNVILVYIVKPLCTQGFVKLGIFLTMATFFDNVWDYFRICNFFYIMLDISDITQNPGMLLRFSNWRWVEVLKNACFGVSEYFFKG